MHLYITYLRLSRNKRTNGLYKYIKHFKRRNSIMPIIIHSYALLLTVFILKHVEGRKPSFRSKAPEIAQRRRRTLQGGVTKHCHWPFGAPPSHCSALVEILRDRLFSVHCSRTHFVVSGRRDMSLRNFVKQTFACSM